MSQHSSFIRKYFCFKIYYGVEIILTRKKLLITRSSPIFTCISSMLKGVTISGKVRFWAMILGTLTWSILRLGSGVMTVLAEKSTLIVVVGLQDVGELVGEIVMVPGLAEHDHGRADTERRDGQSRHQPGCSTPRQRCDGRSRGLSRTDLLLLSVLSVLPPIRRHLQTPGP